MTGKEAQAFSHRIILTPCVIFSTLIFVLPSTKASGLPSSSKSKPQDPKTTATTPHKASERSYDRAELLTRTALSYRGMPYRWGGSSPRSGFDCSGFVQAVYRKWGIYLPHCTSEQLHMGRRIPKDQLQAGDLVFFKNTYRHGVSHVGIYVGQGWFINAADYGQGVTLSQLKSAYNEHHWLEARRIKLKAVAESNEVRKPITVTVHEGGHNIKIVLGPTQHR